MKWRVVVMAVTLGFLTFFMIMISTEGDDGDARIVFAMGNKEHNAFPDIFSIDINGKNLKNLTDHPAFDSFPAPSPNGRHIAFSSHRVGGKSAIFIMDADGKNPRLLINSIFSITGVSWSPDSKWVAFMEGLSKLVAFNINSGERKEIIKNVFQIKEAGGGLLTYEPAWSPDGQKIAFRILGAKNNKRGDIYTIDIDGANLKQLTNNDPEDDANPAWSPDGKQIAFWSSKDGGSILIMDSDGGNAKLIRRGGNMPDWSADGKKIVFYSNLPGRDGIFVMNSDGSNEKQIFKEGGAPRWLEQRFFRVESAGKWTTTWGKIKANHESLKRHERHEKRQN